MLDLFKSRVTDEGETADHGATGDLQSPSPTDRAGSERDDTSMVENSQGATSPPPGLGLDEVFGILQNRRRRDVLRHLLEHTSEADLGSLAEQIAARECGKPVSQLDSQERKRVYIGLYQCHLPKLADVGVIDYNRPRGVIERGPTFDHVTHYLPPEELPVAAGASDRSLIESASTIVSAGLDLF